MFKKQKQKQIIKQNATTFDVFLFLIRNRSKTIVQKWDAMR